MDFDAKSVAIGAGVAVAGLYLIGSSGKKTTKSSGARKRKGLGATYVVSGTARKVGAKRAAGVRKAAAGGAVKAAKRKRAPKKKK